MSKRIIDAYKVRKCPNWVKLIRLFVNVHFVIDILLIFVLKGIKYWIETSETHYLVERIRCRLVLKCLCKLLALYSPF